MPYTPTDVVVKKKVPYHDLKVPQHYRLMGYRPHTVHESAQGYVPVGLMRQLRSGAEDEVIDLPLPKLQLPLEVQAELSAAAAGGGEAASQRTSEAESSNAGTAAATQQQQQQIVRPEPLRPPNALFTPIDYPALHIFVSHARTFCVLVQRICHLCCVMPSSQCCMYICWENIFEAS